MELCWRPDRWVREVWISCSLIDESWASSREESKTMPKYSRVVEGSNLSSVRGTPRALHRELRMRGGVCTVLILVHLPRKNHRGNGGCERSSSVWLATLWLLLDS